MVIFEEHTYMSDTASHSVGYLGESLVSLLWKPNFFCLVHQLSWLRIDACVCSPRVPGFLRVATRSFGSPPRLYQET
jgi:hypothetical protein